MPSGWWRPSPSHPYLVTITRDKQGQVTGRWVGFLFEDDRAYHKVAWGLLRYWLRLEGGIERSDEYLLRLYTYIVAWLYEYVYLVTPGRPVEMRGRRRRAVVMAPKLMNCFIGALTVVPMLRARAASSAATRRRLRRRRWPGRSGRR